MGNVYRFVGKQGSNCGDREYNCAIHVNKSDLIHLICDLFAGDPEPAGIKLHPF